MDSERRFWRWGLVATLVAFFFLSQILSSTSNTLFISPDETANAVFIGSFVGGNGLLMEAPFEGWRTVHPRATFANDQGIWPVGFLGLPVLYGSIIALLGYGLFPLLTPLVGIGGLLAFFGMSKRFFDERIALISTIILAFHPAWLYYSARHLMPNVLFVSLLLIGLWCVLTRGRKQISFMVLGGIAIGLALFVRTSELIWVGLLLMGLWIAYRNNTCCRKIKAVVLGMVIGLIPMALFNEWTYGSPFTFGYQASQLAAVAEQGGQLMEQSAQAAGNLWVTIQSKLQGVFPFGIHPRTVVQNVGAYLVSLTWWLTIPTIAGLIFWRDKLKTLPGKWWMVAAAAWLLVAYGSWTIVDNPDPNQVTIANSYVRYWLPVFIVLVPFIGVALVRLAQKLNPGNRIGTFTTLFVSVVLLSALNIHLTFFAPPDGLKFVAAQLERDQEIQTALLSSIPETAITIVDRADKLLWPQRQVVVPLRTESTYALMPQIIEQAIPLYYYGVTFPERDITYLNEKKLAELDLQILLIETFDAESLYEITAR